ncbi:aminotransferase class III-fold pyridoxal phosphate-dependent enzyme [Mycolicibacterium sp. YH-1]|uniref:aminotransferase class III-fold pyridoxal phosphate-dependent enzyme n=1 Tax=Mycolicibacterium sp. YH-1 TaxID=2908837 RepID=UPI001F4C19F0|nr:aminotransferase class III-fold pyridoxal phosphate-dependent enzyme [Mycolicibacterium sp. YH-1]UNB53024.1 aminotransferase class III-fold pyridoxal phosphate-dependent enzyme [Mycolicibacterium sp. YH-1]
MLPNSTSPNLTSRRHGRDVNDVSAFTALVEESGLNAASPPLPEQVVESALATWFGMTGELTRIPTEKDDTFELDGNTGRHLVKVSGAQEDPGIVNLQTAALRHIEAASPRLPVPRMRQGTDGAYEYRLADPAHGGRVLRVMSFLSGAPLSGTAATPGQLQSVGAGQAAVTSALSRFHHFRQDRRLVWDLRHFPALRVLLDSIDDTAHRRLASQVFDSFHEVVAPRIPGLRHQVVHGDFSTHNILVDSGQAEFVSGIIDFGDTLRTAEIFDVAIAMSNLLDPDAADPWHRALDHLTGYRAHREIDADELAVLPVAVAARSAQRALIAQWRARRDPSRADYVLAHAAQDWHALEAVAAAPAPQAEFSPRRKPAMVNGFAAVDLARQPAPNRARIQRRQRLLGPGYQLFYTDPVDIARGSGVHLYDSDGHEYLDAYNNVASIGHCHPAVADAVAAQLRVVNTNTRYLQDQILDYSEDLLSTFPADLDRVTYTCTGSEANDLAIRIARAHTGAEGIIVTRNAYHGVTETVAAFSPSLGPTSPLGPHVRLIEAPDGGRLPGGDVAEFMRQQVRQAIADLNRHGYGLCALVADSIFSSDGVFATPTSVLGAVAQEVRRAGGLYIADEVQSGFGRTGDAWWGFQRHGVVPDIVTIGKPMGNGIPVAAVVLKRAVGNAFGDNVRYFNTFGGSNVPIAAAGAVLDVIRGDRLIENARTVGTYLLDELRSGCASREQVFEIRGAGLFIGVDIVEDRQSATPNGALAKQIVDDLRRNFVLVSASGPEGNVLKIRPPLVFGRAHADRLLEAFFAAFDRWSER